MQFPQQAVLLCGGLGKRLRPITNLVPKPLAQLNGKPFLSYLFKQLSDQGIRKILLLAGYKSDLIEKFVQSFDDQKLDIILVKGSIDWETGKRIYEARNLIEDSFILLYGDNFAPFCLNSVFKKNIEMDTIATLTLHKKREGNIKIHNEHIISKYDPTRNSEGLTHVEVGYMHIKKSRFLKHLNKNDSLSTTIKKLADNKLLSYVENKSKYYSISDINRLKITEKHLKTKKIILIDRDGTINEKPEKMNYIKKWDEIVLIDSTLRAMKKLSQMNFEFILISNQAGIGRSILTRKEVNKVNNELKSFLLKEGVNILDWYICPHHWEDNCECRKPKPGLLFKASDDYDLCLANTLFIGDDVRDVYAANYAGAKSAIIGPDFDKCDESKGLPSKSAYDLDDLIDWINDIYSE